MAIAVVAGVIGLPRVLGTGRRVAVSAQSGIAGAISADPAAPVVLRFSQPMNQAATVAALHLSPSTTLRTSWQDNTLTLTPTHGFAPNAAYLLTIDRAVAATSSGARLTGDLHLAFGTAPAAVGGSAAATPVTLRRTTVADADADSEAVVTTDGSLLLTGARSGPGTDGHAGLVRIGDGRTVRLSAATEAICLSRSGHSVAFLTRSGSGSRVVFAGGDGTPTASVRVAVDADSPLGWIDDAKVSFVSDGRLRAVDAAGHVTTLSDASIAAHDTLALSPGGRYAFVGPATGTGGKIIDLVSGAAHSLPGIVGSPAFDGDGATVAWFEAAAGRQLIAVAASGGGPVLTAALPVRAGDKLSDLALSPDGTRFVYSVAGADGRAELRVATLPDARTVAVSAGGIGESPNFSASGREFAVLGVGAGTPRIQTVGLPDSVTGQQPAWLGPATAYANTQVSGDGGAQAALAEPGAALPAPPRITRAAVIWGRTAADGTATAGIRLTVDATSGGTAAREADETLELGPGAGGNLVVRKATIGSWHPVPAGPQLARLDTAGSPGAVRLVFDADLDAATVPGALALTTSAGRSIPATVSYDPAHRTATVRPVSDGGAATVMVAIGAGLRDVDGHPYAGGPPIAADLSR